MNLNERIIAAGVKHSTEKNKTWINNNVLVVGSSGAGKTTGFVCPNLNNPSGSFVVSDTKGQLYKMFASKLRKKGYLVHLINLVNPEHSFGYNPLDYIRRRKDGSVYEPDIKKLAKLIVPALDRAEPYWENSAARYISMLIGYVVEALPREEQNMESILELHRSYYEGPSKVLLSQLKTVNLTAMPAEDLQLSSRLRIPRRRGAAYMTSPAKHWMLSIARSIRNFSQARRKLTSTILANAKRQYSSIRRITTGVITYFAA